MIITNKRIKIKYKQNTTTTIMYYILKLIAVICIFYMKINGLNTTPVINRYKLQYDDVADEKNTSSNKRNSKSNNHQNQHTRNTKSTSTSTSIPLVLFTALSTTSALASASLVGTNNANNSSSIATTAAIMQVSVAATIYDKNNQNEFLYDNSKNDSGNKFDKSYETSYIDGEYQLNAIAGASGSIVVDTDDGYQSDNSIASNKSTSISLSNNLTTIEIIEPAPGTSLNDYNSSASSRTNETTYQTNYYHYNVVVNKTENNNNNGTHTPQTTLPVADFKSLENAYRTAIDEDEVRGSVKMPSIKTEEFSAFTTSTPSSDDASTEEPAFGFQNSANSGYSNSDVDKFLMNYESDNGNKCIMDEVKANFLWWSYANGSLRLINFNDTSSKSKHHFYMDMSHQNITDDETLYQRVKQYFYFKTKHIIVFSAAHNNLSNVPYQTLSLMRETLHYLTLKGNKFAANPTEVNKEAISRIINDNGLFPDSTNTENETETENDSDDNLSNTQQTPTIQNTVEPHYKEHEVHNKPERHRSTYRHYKRQTRRILQRNVEEGIAWATFPELPVLMELDVSDCHIEYVTKDAFKSFPNLRRLYIAHNNMLKIPSDTFAYIPKLQYLDMSFTNVFLSEYTIPFPTVNAVLNLIYGLKIQQHAFKNLTELVYLDMSHTKITRNSAVAFTHLGPKLKYLSLCFTAFPMFGNAFFKNTGLVALDLSGNPIAAYNIMEDALEGVADTLKYLFFERSNLKELSWLKYLNKLRVLGLSGNNIHLLSLDTFGALKNLQILDLSSNHIGNWYQRAFTNNEQLRMLNMRDNNINILTSEMLRDFELLDYLSLGDNNFVCDCLLRDLVDVAASNNKDAECARNMLKDAHDVLLENFEWMDESMLPNITKAGLQRTLQNKLKVKDLGQLILNRYIPKLKQSLHNIRIYKNGKEIRPRFRFLTRFRSHSALKCPEPESVGIYDKLNSSALKFQLLDYEDERYWCFNETERLNFEQLQCKRSISMEAISKDIQIIRKYIVSFVSALVVLTLIGIIAYMKRWHIQYYYSSLKTAALVSKASKEAADKLNAMDPNLVYDIFISYCDNDRDWVLQELLPNVEEAGDLSICLHERDFEIGVTILNNITSCMERSRSLMLIVSSNFLLSRWCQFEMHLAHHRMLDVNKEHLILVFLDDIPLSKRPKTLQYLMEMKTYIKWPKSAKPDERKLFWKRLKRSLDNIGISPSESFV